MASANVWDNLWSNNEVERIVFPRQFEFKVSWNATIGNSSSTNNTNYIQMALKIDGETNRVKIQTNFSTLSLTPQELLSFIIDFNNKMLFLKQRESCRFYDLRIPGTYSVDGKPPTVETLPNIADIFELWPYVMFFNQTLTLDGKE